MKTVFLARCNADTVEGRGAMIPKAAFTHKSDAVTFIDNKPGIMGRKSTKGGWSKERGGDWDVEPLIVFDSLQEQETYKKDDFKRQALAKLSTEEKIALGLPID